MVCQEDPKWDLNEEVIIDLKEIFLMFDTDQVSKRGAETANIFIVLFAGWSLDY